MLETRRGYHVRTVTSAVLFQLHLFSFSGYVAAHPEGSTVIEDIGTLNGY